MPECSPRWYVCGMCVCVCVCNYEEESSSTRWSACLLSSVFRMSTSLSVSFSFLRSVSLAFWSCWFSASSDSCVGLLSSSRSLGFCTIEARFSHLAQWRCFLWGTGLGHEVRLEPVVGTSKSGSSWPDSWAGEVSWEMSVWVPVWTQWERTRDVSGE